MEFQEVLIAFGKSFQVPSGVAAGTRVGRQPSLQEGLGRPLPLLGRPAPSQSTSELLLLLQGSAVVSPPPGSPPCIPQTVLALTTAPKHALGFLIVTCLSPSLDCKLPRPGMLSITFCDRRGSPSAQHKRSYLINT